MDREYQAGGYGGSGYDGLHRRNYGRSQFRFLMLQWLRHGLGTHLQSHTDVEEDLSPITPHPCYNGCDIDAQSIEVGRIWRLSDRARATLSMYVEAGRRLLDVRENAHETSD